LILLTFAPFSGIMIARILTKTNRFSCSFLTDFKYKGAKTMYKPIDKLQHSFLDFNQPMGLHMNPDNRWVRLADRIPWDEFEVKYAKLFPSDTGNVAKPLRMALFVTNLFRIQRRILCALLHLFRFWHDRNRCKSWKLQIAA